VIPAELVIDHSVIADVFARPDAFRVNADLEFGRNRERYQLLRWAQQAFDDFRVVPPDTGSATIREARSILGVPGG
jgi:aconitate hydratase